MNNWERYFKEKPVSPKDFLNDSFLNRDFLEHINDWVRESFIDIFNESNSNNVYILNNKSHNGKSTLVLLSNIYLSYIFNLLKNPADFFGVSDGTKLSIVVESSKIEFLDILIRLAIGKSSKKAKDNLKYLSIDEPADLIGLNPIFAIGNLDFFRDGEKDFFEVSKEVCKRINCRKDDCNLFFKTILEWKSSDDKIISKWIEDVSNECEGASIIVL